MKTVLATLLTLALGSCSHDSERTLLSQFFAASRLRDLTALRKFGTVVFEPARDGIVTRFEIVQITRRESGAEVLITAPVRLPDGRTVPKNYTMTIHDGLVTAFSERPALSPVEGPASPSTPRP